jgi:hypothetical protein
MFLILSYGSSSPENPNSSNLLSALLEVDFSRFSRPPQGQALSRPAV